MATLPLTVVATGAYSTSGDTSPLDLPIPAGATEGRVLFALIMLKPGTGVVTAPADWSEVYSSASLGTGTAGTGVGTVTLKVLSRVVPAGGLTGSVAFTTGTSNSYMGRMLLAEVSEPDYRLSVTGVTHTRTTASTTFGGTGSANLDLATDDLFVYVSMAPDDQSTNHDNGNNHTLTATGTTLGTLTKLGTGVTTTGGDASMFISHRTVTAGTSSAAPVATLTSNSSETGGGVFLRFRATEPEISFVSAEVRPRGYATITTMPAHQAGDLLLMFASNTSSTGLPTLPSGWTSITAGYETPLSGINVAWRLAYQIATSSSTASGSWSGVTDLACSVYRDVNPVKPIGEVKVQAYWDNDAFLPGLSGLATDSWVVCDYATLAPRLTNYTVNGLTRRDQEEDYQWLGDTAAPVGTTTFAGREAMTGIPSLDPTVSVNYSVELRNYFAEPMYVSHENRTFEGGTTGDWSFNNFWGGTTGTLSNSTTRAASGSRSLKVDLAPNSSSNWPVTSMSGFTIGTTYLLTVKTYNPSVGGVEDISLQAPFQYQGPFLATKDQWVTHTVEWVADTASEWFGLYVPDAVGAEGGSFWIDEVSIRVAPITLAGTVGVSCSTGGSFSKRSSLSGTVGAVSTTSGGITLIPGSVTYQVTGTVAVVSTTAALPNIRAPTTGTVAVVSTTAGNATRLLLTLPATGTAPVTSATSGALTKRTAASGTSAVVSSVQGDATRSLLTLPITGTTTVSSTTAGSITARAQIAGTSSTVSTVSGAATREPRTFPIGGTSPAQSVAAGALTALLQGAGTSAVVSNTAAAQSLRAKIAGQNTLLTTSAGDIDATRVVLGTISVLSVVAGDPVIYVAPSIPAYPGLPYPGTTWPSYETAIPGQVKVGSLNQKVPAQVYRSGTWKRAPVKVFKSGTWKETL